MPPFGYRVTVLGHTSSLASDHHKGRRSIVLTTFLGTSVKWVCSLAVTSLFPKNSYHIITFS